MIPVLEKILRSQKVYSDDGECLALGGNIPLDSGLFLQKLILENRPHCSLEIGMAYGISTLFICEALQSCGAGKHIIIDPGQFKSTPTQPSYRGIGMKHVREAGLDHLVTFIEEPSELALPSLLAQGTRVDFAFIDGWHTFDHTLLDFFYITRLLNVGGIVAVDDVYMSAIAKACAYIASYPCYELLGVQADVDHRDLRGVMKTMVYTIAQLPLLNRVLRPEYAFRIFKQLSRARVVALRKVSEDQRPWNWYAAF